ncbi:hypothetical protein Ade02nite_73810 [Paractinoplanes deccanensis]|uniref:Uncharacterized protein n=1 Tax=Paractinoplanes deccanensis TaxID=113561 RepID=A0ABQ3YFF0_9ACTN|nr:hypothetical protein Ade02nite_73810 [Actinoplanes deccanensis]
MARRPPGSTGNGEGDAGRSAPRGGPPASVVGGLMVAGDLGDDGFVRWPEAAPEMVRKVVAQCESFGWAPLGAACWLANTEASDERARATL